MSPTTKSNSLIIAEGKIKQLEEALQLCNKIAMQAQWAQDFTKFSSIREGMECILNVTDEVEQNLSKELDYVYYQVDDYETKMLQFEIDNQIFIKE